MQIAQFDIAQAEDVLRNFQTRHGAHIFALACYAAVPNALTPDLLQGLRVNFHLDQGRYGQPVIWEHGVRFLLSEIVEQVDEEIYEMDVELRRQLLKRLQYGCQVDISEGKKDEQTLKEVSRFLLAYYAPVLKNPAHHQYDLARMQEITAYAYLDAEVAYKELREEFERLGDSGNRSERMRLATLVESLREQFEEEHMDELVQYAQSWQFDIHENDGELRSVMQPLVENMPGPTEEKGVPMPVPQEMYKQLRAEQIARDPEAEAMRRIEEWQVERTARLDLSGIGLTRLPTALFGEPDIHVLDLSQNHLEALPPEIGQIKSLKALHASHNALRIIPNELSELGFLETVDFSYNKLRRFPHRWWVNGRLREVDLSHNLFGSLTDEFLSQEFKVKLTGNPLPEMPTESSFESQGSFQQQQQQQAPRGGPSEVSSLDQFASPAYLSWLSELMHKMENGEQKVLKLLIFGRESEVSSRDEVLRSLVGSRLDIHNLKHPEEWASTHYLVTGRQMGLSADALLHAQGIITGLEIGVEPFCTHNSILALNLLVDSVNDDGLYMERWIARLPKHVNLNLAVFVWNSRDPYLLELAELMQERYPHVGEVVLVNPFNAVDRERFWDLAADRFPRNALEVPNREAFKRLLNLLFRDGYLQDMDFSTVEESSLTGEGDYGSYFSERLESLGEVATLELPMREGTYWSAFFQQQLLRRALGNETRVFEEGEIYELLGKFEVLRQNVYELIEQAKKWGWLVLDGNGDYLYLYDPLNHRKGSSISSNTILQATFDALPPDVAVGLLQQYQFGRYKVLPGNQAVEVNRESAKEVWEVRMQDHHLHVHFDLESIPTQNIERAKSAIENAVVSIPKANLPEFWVKSQFPDEVPMHLETLLKIRDQGKASVAHFDSYEWHKILRILGRDTVKKPVKIPSNRRFLMLYARDDFESAFDIMQRFEATFDQQGRSSKTARDIFPYTPDLYQPLTNPEFRKLLGPPEKVILYMTEHFLHSTQCMNYFRTAMETMGESDPRRKTYVLSNLNLNGAAKAQAETEVLAEYWNAEKAKPVPNQPLETTSVHPRSLQVQAAQDISLSIRKIMDLEKYAGVFNDPEELLDLINALEASS